MMRPPKKGVRSTLPEQVVMRFLYRWLSDALIYINENFAVGAERKEIELQTNSLGLGLVCSIEEK